jgi:hypothetical protein
MIYFLGFRELSCHFRNNRLKTGLVDFFELVSNGGNYRYGVAY